MGPAIIVPLAAFAMAIILGIGIPIAKAFARRMDADSRQQRVPNEVAERKLLSEGAGRGEARQVGPANAAQDRLT